MRASLHIPVALTVGVGVIVAVGVELRDAVPVEVELGYVTNAKICKVSECIPSLLQLARGYDVSVKEVTFEAL